MCHRRACGGGHTHTHTHKQLNVFQQRKEHEKSTINLHQSRPLKRNPMQGRQQRELYSFRYYNPLVFSRWWKMELGHGVLSGGFFFLLLTCVLVTNKAAKVHCHCYFSRTGGLLFYSCAEEKFCRPGCVRQVERIKLQPSPSVGRCCRVWSHSWNLAGLSFYRLLRFYGKVPGYD